MPNTAPRAVTALRFPGAQPQEEMALPAALLVPTVVACIIFIAYLIQTVLGLQALRVALQRSKSAQMAFRRAPWNAGTPFLQSALRSYGRILPMIDRKAKLVMAWTPRAACTLSVSIFVDHLGRLAEAQAYEDGFIHSFRQDVLGPAYVATEADLANASLFKLKIVRNPYPQAG